MNVPVLKANEKAPTLAVNCVLNHRHDHLNPGGCVPHPCGCGEPSVYGFLGRFWCAVCYLRGLTVVGAAR